jgi:spore coat polysaccharide biosynthesis predicted glycosyltransferase SpsG/RimJ/RimL family protein N-acetyltransferase
MKVLIITEGGKSIGFGHITRCISIYQAFEKRKIIPEIIINADSSVKGLLAGKKYKLFDWLKQKGRLLKILDKTDIAIIDSYLAGQVIYKNISALVPIPVYIDDNKRLDYPRGVVVNGAIYAKEINYPPQADTTYLTGTEYFPIRREFAETSRKKISRALKTVMVTFGGNDLRNMIPRVLKFLQKNYPKLIKKVVIGRGMKNIRQIEKLKDGKTVLVYYPNAFAMKKLMQDADIAVSSGGQTLYELARIGVPTLAVAVAENQLANTRSWSENGLMEYAGYCSEDRLFSKLSQGIKKLASYDIRVKKSRALKKYIDGHGAEHLVKSILEKASAAKLNRNFRLRKASRKDCYDLWFWRNHRLVRKYCFDSKKIKYISHKKWFEKKIKDKNAAIYIAEDDKFKIGQIRFEKNNKWSAHVNVNLNPKLLGRGFGKKIIHDATALFMKQNPRIKEIVAEVMGNNIISRKAFSSAGYIFLKSKFRNNKKIAILAVRRGNVKH